MNTIISTNLSLLALVLSTGHFFLTATLSTTSRLLAFPPYSFAPSGGMDSSSPSSFHQAVRVNRIYRKLGKREWNYRRAKKKS